MIVNRKNVKYNLDNESKKDKEKVKKIFERGIDR